MQGQCRRCGAQVSCVHGPGSQHGEGTQDAVKFKGGLGFGKD